MNSNCPPPPHYVEAGICDPTDTQSICDDSITHPTGSPDGFRLELGDQDLPILRRDCGDDVHQAGLRWQPVFGGCPGLHPERRALSMIEVTMFQGQAARRITYKPCHQFSWLQHPLTRDNRGSNACDCQGNGRKFMTSCSLEYQGESQMTRGQGPGQWHSWGLAHGGAPASDATPAQLPPYSLHLGWGQPSRGASSAHCSWDEASPLVGPAQLTESGTRPALSWGWLSTLWEGQTRTWPLRAPLSVL